MLFKGAVTLRDVLESPPALETVIYEMNEEVSELLELREWEVKKQTGIRNVINKLRGRGVG